MALVRNTEKYETCEIKLLIDVGVKYAMDNLFNDIKYVKRNRTG